MRPLRTLVPALTFVAILIPFTGAHAQGQAGVLVVYESGDLADPAAATELRAAVIGADGAIVVGAPRVVASEPGRQLTETALIADGQGGAFVAWQSSPTDTYAWDVRLLRLDARGVPAWPAPVTVAATPNDETSIALALDGAGGVFVGWSRTDDDYVEHVTVQRRDGKGAPLWDAVALSTPTESAWLTYLVPDGQGGVYVVYDQTGEQPTATCAQRVAADGRVLWPTGADAVRVFGSGLTESAANALATPDGGIVVVGQEDIRMGERAGYSAVLMQGLSPEGKLRWGATPAPLRIEDVLGSAFSPAVAADGSGGLYVAYEVVDPSFQADSGNLPDNDVMVQHVDATGALLWTAEPMLVFGSDRREFSSCVAAAPGGGLYMAAIAGERSLGSQADVVVQRLDAAGTELWGADGDPVHLGPAGVEFEQPVLAPVGQGLVVLALASDAFSEAPTRLQVATIDGSGAPGAQGFVPVDAGSKGERSVQVLVLPGR